MGSGASSTGTHSKAQQEEEITHSVSELIHDATDEFRSNNVAAAHQLLKRAREMLPSISSGQRDHYSIVVHSKQGSFYYREGLYAKAEDAYTVAIRLEEAQIEAKCKGLYLMLQRYRDDMCDLARIRKMDGDGKCTRSEEANAKASNDDGSSRVSLEGRISANRADDYARCEALLVRCIETVENGHNRRSDLLVEPLSLLAELYEQLNMYSRSELLCRRMKGIMIVQYGHDHPGLSELNTRIDALAAQREQSAVTHAAVKIQSVFRMRKAMAAVGTSLDKTMKRHRLQLPTAHEASRNSKFLSEFCKKIPEGNEAGHIPDASVVGTTASALPPDAAAPAADNQTAQSIGSHSHLSKPRTQSSSKLRGILQPAH